MIALINLLAIFLYLVRMVAIGVATGTVFCRYGLFPEVGRGQVVLLGLCVSPMVVSMMNYLLGLVFIGWPSWFFYAVPLITAFAWLMQGENRVLLQSVCKKTLDELRKECVLLGKWGIIDFALALGFVGFLASIYYLTYIFYTRIFFGYGIVSRIKNFIAMPHACELIIAIIIAMVILAIGIFRAGCYCGHRNKEKNILSNQGYITTFFLIVGFIVLAGGIITAYKIFVEAQFAIMEIRALIVKVAPIAVFITISIVATGIFFAGWYYEQWSKNKEFVFKQAFVVAVLSIVGSAVLAGGIYNAYPMIGSDWSHYELNARYFAASRNSWEIDDYKDERHGSSLRDDHGALWITELVDPRLVADTIGADNTLRISNFNLFWNYICFSIMLFLVAYCITGNAKAGIMAHLLFGLYRYDINFFLGQGSRDAFRFVGLLLLFLYAGTIFHVMVDNRAKWSHYAFMAFCCWLSMNGHTGNVFIMLGLFLCMLILFLVKGNFKAAFLCGLSAFLGTLIGIAKTISIYIETHELTSSMLLPFHGTQVIEMAQQLDIRFNTWEIIWGTYRLPELFLMGLGIVGLLVMLSEAKREKNQEILVWGLLALGMLLPLSGAMDWIGYDCSRRFFGQLRYRMYFFMLFSITGGFFLNHSWKDSFVKIVSVILSVVVMVTWGYVEIYKYRMFNIRSTAHSQKLVNQYNCIADKIESISEGDAFVQRQPLLYYLHGTPKLLFHIYSEPLIQAKTYKEIDEAIDVLNVGAIVLPASGCEDYIDYSLLPFWEYIQEEFICYSSENFGKYVIFFNPGLMRRNTFLLEGS